MKGIECTEALMPDPESSVEGLHLEGPYFSVKMAGAQLPELIRIARPEEYTKIMARGQGIIRRWDAAPEIEGTLEFGRYVRERGVVTAIAHTEAGEKEIKEAWEHGYTLATHFYNAMKVSHKKGVYKMPGAVETILDMPDFDIEVICDGIHVPPLMVHLAYATKGRERMALTTDALLYTGTPPDFKDPTGHAIVEDGVCKLSDPFGSSWEHCDDGSPHPHCGQAGSYPPDRCGLYGFGDTCSYHGYSGYEGCPRGWKGCRYPLPRRRPRATLRDAPWACRAWRGISLLAFPSEAHNNIVLTRGYTAGFAVV